MSLNRVHRFTVSQLNSSGRLNAHLGTLLLLLLFYSANPKFEDKPVVAGSEYTACWESSFACICALLFRLRMQIQQLSYE